MTIVLWITLFLVVGIICIYVIRRGINSTKISQKNNQKQTWAHQLNDNINIDDIHDMITKHTISKLQEIIGDNSHLYPIKMNQNYNSNIRYYYDSDTIELTIKYKISLDKKGETDVHN